MVRFCVSWPRCLFQGTQFDADRQQHRCCKVCQENYGARHGAHCQHIEVADPQEAALAEATLDAEEAAGRARAAANEAAAQPPRPQQPQDAAAALQSAASGGLSLLNPQQQQPQEPRRAAAAADAQRHGRTEYGKSDRAKEAEAERQRPRRRSRPDEIDEALNETLKAECELWKLATFAM